MRLSILIPCYNEVKTIGLLLSKVNNVLLPTGWEKEIIIVDDGSTDGSREYLEKRNDVKIILRPQNNGKGAALKDGFKVCTGDYILIQDADLECDPEDYPQLLLPVIQQKSAVVFGIRNHPVKVSFLKSFNFFGGLLLTKFYNLLFGKSLHDMACCYKLFSNKYLQEVINLPYNDFRYDVVYLTHCLASSENPAEVPVTYNLRTKKEGKKMNYKVGFLCFREILKLRFAL